jgi:hypothetical protein
MPIHRIALEVAGAGEENQTVNTFQPVLEE